MNVVGTQPITRILVCINQFTQWIYTMARFVLLLFGLVCMVTTLAHSKYGNFTHIVFVRNYDGDTITVSIPNVHPIIGEKVNVRIAGIDTPEIRGKCAKEKVFAKIVKNFVYTKMTQANNIELHNVDRPKYFRILATVIIDGEDLGKVLIDNGYAVRYDGGKKIDWCKRLNSDSDHTTQLD